MKRETYKRISAVIGDYVKESNLEDGLLRTRVFEAWDMILASRFPFMRPEDIPALTSRKYYKDGVLSCRMASSVVRLQLQFQAESLRLALNGMLQDDCVSKIVIS